eukprot:14558417-Ditylum_brightwellii.AAC.1
MLELQQVTQQTSYNVNKIRCKQQDNVQTAEAIESLAQTTEHDRIAMANLVEVNYHLIEQLVNSIRKLDTKDKDIMNLTANIADFTSAMEQISRSNENYH